jgi:RNA polymerase sigma-70 factor (ECF subfamily)
MANLPLPTLLHLLSQVEKNDQKAFNRIYHHYNAYVFSFAMLMHSNREDAEEVVDDVFMALHSGVGTIKNHAHFLTWLIEITKHKVFDRMRLRGRRIRTESFEDIEWCDLPDAAGDVLNQVIANEYERTFERCQDQLPIEQKEAWFLVSIELCSMQEIATKQNCPVGTVKSRLFNASQKIKRCMGLLK